ncbi:bifunctional acetate--CoA ligase family protein/GNAT family N-acetyltransferase [Ramlibacter sp.]|uniref:bifunctional acetate--CoA ligase family protein/GNAT family N-acetyltransferase n=1 Tax=Ramlibacter sp. TaxID=1917967 RepID=UPI002C1F5B55|nr:bifunctional acetate--CoA ligase family protein/GNAT family N-acetyltransferase [Ramlibacter sp.]HWI81112.1 bifunctional acetate--CoA ligase family protein/GNAT family N-acetyltransferase [Ramlibacter sp.]
MSVRNLDALFAPAAVAVIGVSERPDNVGHVVFRNLRAGGFPGPLWIVDRRQGLIAGQQAYPDIESLPQAPDLAVICTPAASVPGLVEALARKGTRAAAVLSAGLRGTPAEQAMLAAARPALLRILGPNCLGVLVPGAGLNASFSPGNALPGSLAFVTQSGALSTAMLDWANSHGIGFSHFVSLGDCADVDFGDVLDYLASDPGTRAILMYMEAVQSARKFMSAARAAARNKPVIVVKAGRVAEGARAAASHTGALAGSDTVFDAAVRRAGMLRVDTLEALFDAAETLAHVKTWRGERLAILTNGGGAGVLAADALAMGRGRMAELSPATVQALDRCLPATWPRGNPVDIVGDAPVARYGEALRIVLDAPEVDGVLFMHSPTAIVPAGEIAAACLPIVQQATKPVLACWLGGDAVASARRAFSGAGIATYNTPERAVAGWLQRASYARNQEALLQLPADTLEDFRPDVAAAEAILQAALREGREWLDNAQATQLLQAYGIPAVAAAKVRDVDEAVLAAARIGYPVALKIVSPEIVHKSDVGGVALGLGSADDVRAAAVRMRQRVAHAQPHAHVLGFTVQAMAQRRHAQELIVGIASDGVFGPVVLFGEGGTAVELRKDRAVGLPPLNGRLARDLIDQTHVGALLAGYRGHPPVDRQALVGAMLRVSQLACDLPALMELDINPLLADAEGVIALDARVRVRRPAPGEASRLAVRPYPSGLEQRLQVGDHELLLRPIRPEDGERLAAFYGKASPADMRLRFFLARREVPHSELARYCQIDYDRDMTFLALAGTGPAAAMAGEVRAVCDPDNRQAEFAIQVAGPWQRQGLGRALLGKLLAYLRARGTQEVVGQCLSENAGMAALARQLGFEVTAQPGGVMAMRLVLR